MVWPFGRKDSSALSKLRGAEWTCADCELPHVGMFDLAAFAPDPWSGAEEYEPNSAIRLEGDFLSEDFCVLGGEYFFVRCVLEIPVHGIDEKFGYGCWGTLKRENIELYCDHFDAGTVPDSAPFWSWLCNSLRPYDMTEPLGCLMFPQAHRQRPVLKVEPCDHPLFAAQEEGITPEQLFGIYAAHGHSVA